MSLTQLEPHIDCVMEKVVGSSHVDEYGYDEPTSTLVAKYKDGSVYHWHGVPLSAFTDMHAAVSKGKYIRQISEKYGRGIRAM
jgi:hypothetical protein